MQQAEKKRTGRKREPGSVSGYFRGILEKRPELLDGEGSNAILLEMWKKDHNKTEVPDSIRANLANLKSTIRRKLRQGKPMSGRLQHAVLNRGPRSPQMTQLETLEIKIDDCLAYAITLGDVDLESVIQRLRKARNEVVWKMGESAHQD